MITKMASDTYVTLDDKHRYHDADVLCDIPLTKCFSLNFIEILSFFKIACGKIFIGNVGVELNLVDS